MASKSRQVFNFHKAFEVNLLRAAAAINEGYELTRHERDVLSGVVKSAASFVRGEGERRKNLYD